MNPEAFKDRIKKAIKNSSKGPGKTKLQVHRMRKQITSRIGHKGNDQIRKFARDHAVNVIKNKGKLSNI